IRDFHVTEVQTCALPILIVVCVIGRTWSSIYIAGHKVQTLVMDGPYSISRNPLYVFSIIGAAGAGAQLGSIVLALAAGFVAWIRSEERREGNGCRTRDSE